MYNILASYSTQIRNDQIFITQEEDAISTLVELHSELMTEQKDLIRNVTSMELERRLTHAELCGAECCKLSFEKETDEIRNEVQKFGKLSKTKQDKLFQLKNFKTQKMADFQKLHRKSEEQYLEMPHVRSYVEAKRSYDRVATTLKEKKLEIVRLSNELGHVRTIHNANWTTFQKMCVDIARNTCMAQRMDGELETLSLQKKRLKEMAELAHSNQETVSSQIPSSRISKSGEENLLACEKLLKLHARSKSISRSNISQRLVHPLPKSVGALKLPVMLSSLTKLKSIPSALVGKASGLSPSHLSAFFEIKQRLAAEGRNSSKSTSADSEKMELKMTYANSGEETRQKLARMSFKSISRIDEPMDLDADSKNHENTNIEHSKPNITGSGTASNKESVFRLPLTTAQFRLNQKYPENRKAQDASNTELKTNLSVSPDWGDSMPPFGSDQCESSLKKLEMQTGKSCFMTVVEPYGTDLPSDTGFMSSFFDENSNSKSNAKNTGTGSDDIMTIFGWSPLKTSLF